MLVYSYTFYLFYPILALNLYFDLNYYVYDLCLYIFKDILCYFYTCILQVSGFLLRQNWPSPVPFFTIPPPLKFSWSLALNALTTF